MILFICIVVGLVALAGLGACRSIQRTHNEIHGRNRDSESRGDAGPHTGAHLFMPFDIWTPH
jgi:hypothetical protein